MSVILDALRKLDRERLSRRNGAARIAVEILRPDPSRPGRKAPMYLAAFSLTAIAAAALTYGMMSPRGFLSKPKPPPVAPANAPVQNPEADSAPLSRVPVHELKDEAREVHHKMDQPARKSATGTFPSRAKAEGKVISEEPKVAPENTKKPVERTPVGSVWDPSSLKISAIVWYDDPSKRFAMINGTISTEGSFVDGAKIVEIRPSSVRFLHNDEYFEIPISK